MPSIQEILAQRTYANKTTNIITQSVGQGSLFDTGQTESRPLSKRAELSYRRFSEAEQFGAYVGISVKATLGLFKRYGKQRVLSQSSFLRDAPELAQNGKKTNKVGLLVWKLKKDSGSL